MYMEMMYYYKELAKNMRIERARLNISQLKLAEMADVSLDTINMIERAVGNPKLCTVIAIANKHPDKIINYLISLKNSFEISCEYLFFSLAETKTLAFPCSSFTTEMIPEISPIGSFFNFARNFT